MGVFFKQVGNGRRHCARWCQVLVSSSLSHSCRDHSYYTDSLSLSVSDLYAAAAAMQSEADLLKELESLLNHFYSPTSTNEQKQEISESGKLIDISCSKSP